MTENHQKNKNKEPTRCNSVIRYLCGSVFLFDPFLVKNLSREEAFLDIHLCLVGWVARSEDTDPTQVLRNTNTVKCQQVCN